MTSFLLALSFLTVLPVRFRKLPAPGFVARSRFWYPVIGLLLGAVLGGWTALLTGFCPAAISAFLVLLCWVILTGALHLDGFCDLCDGLFGGHAPEDRLRIMKDPHLGTFGLAGGVLLLLGKFVVLWQLLTTAAGQGPWLVAAAVFQARCLVLVVAAGSSYPRAEGTGKALIEATRGWEAGLFAVIGVGGSTALILIGRVTTGDLLRAATLFVPACLAVLGLRALCRRRLGGVTGDCLGAAIEISEWTFLTAAALLPG